MASVVLDYIFDTYLRPYQRKWLADTTRLRIALKARQIGWSDTLALEMVLVAAGLMPDVEANNCNIVSKRQEDAYDVVKKCKRWVDVLRTDPQLGELLVTGAWSASEIEFTRTGFSIRSDTQNPDAGRGKTGHLYLDEYGFYQYQRDIWTGALPSVFSRSGLRVSIVSTPNGTGDHYHEVWTDEGKYTGWSRHRCDVYEAIEQGFPLVVQDVRHNFSQDQWEQEMECKFLGGEAEYFGVELLQESHRSWVRDPNAILWLGVDTASVVDTTAVQLLWVQSDGIWLGDTFVLPNIQYETDVDRKRIGQEFILDAIIRHLKPRGAVIDVTGDMSRTMRGFAALYPMLKMQHQTSGIAILPQTINREWKDTEVQELKSSIESGRTKFAHQRRDYVFSRRGAEVFVDGKFINPDRIGAFIRECFEASAYPVLMQDFRKVYRKWLGPNATTFDTRRDGQGHGDAFWAAILGFSVARVQRYTARKKTSAEIPASQSDYVGLL